jgi:hypothetical protein
VYILRTLADLECRQVLLVLHYYSRALWCVKTVATPRNALFYNLHILSIILAPACFGVVASFRELAPKFHSNMKQ